MFQLREELQVPECVAPHPFELGAEAAEALATGTVDPLALARRAVHEPGVAQRPKLERHGAKRHVGHGAVDVAGRTGLAPDEAQDLAPAGRGHGGKNGGFDDHAM
jgi:hypothetical protein